jgi:outer membrane protein, multidrug efflux system
VTLSHEERTLTRLLTTTTALLALAVAGCAVGPSYKRPDLPVPEAYRAEVTPAEAASIADLPWWEVYRDPVLDGLIREALQNNQDLALAAARVLESGALLGVSKADLWPQLNGQADASWGRGSREVEPGATVGSETGALYSGALALSWELDIWGRVRNSRDAARADLLATEEGRRGVVLGLVASVASSYLQLRELDLELEIAERNTLSRQGTVDLFRQRAEGGVGNDLELNQARADLAVTSADIPDTERQIALVEHQLCVLLGRPPGSIERGETLPAELAPELPTGVPATLLQRRPDLLAAEQSLVAATRRVGVAVADRLPTISLVGTVGLASASLGTLFTCDAAAWSLGGSLFAPIFQGGRLAALEDAARARMEQAVASYRSAVLIALREVSDAAVSYDKLEEVFAQNELQVQATAAAEQLARMRYEGGVANYLEVLDSQRQSYDAELTRVRTLLARLLAGVELYRALGGGWQEPAQPDGQEPPPGGGQEPPQGGGQPPATQAAAQRASS